jgi:hypothetical protein
MQVELDDQEYGTLVEMLHFATWIISAHDVERDPAKARFHALEQKLLALAGDAGCGAMVHHDERQGEHTPTRAVEEQCEELILAYDSATFWQELIRRLSRRDLERELGTDRYAQLDFAGFLEQVERHEERYVNEFEAHDLDRLEIVSEPRPRVATRH